MSSKGPFPVNLAPEKSMHPCLTLCSPVTGESPRTRPAAHNHATARRHRTSHQVSLTLSLPVSLSVSLSASLSVSWSRSLPRLEASLPGVTWHVASSRCEAGGCWVWPECSGALRLQGLGFRVSARMGCDWWFMCVLRRERECVCERRRRRRRLDLGLKP